jgi:outer membrane protein TolC
MNKHLEPRHEFVSNLEWQIRTSYQRQDRFAEPVKGNLGGKMKIGVLVLASALMGAGGVVVKDGVQEARAQEILVARISAELRMAELEAEFVQNRLLETERQYEAGVVTKDAVESARVAAVEAEENLERLRLDLEEVQLSGKEPRNEVSAPLVEGRDFVSERLVTEEAIASAWAELVFQQLERVQDLHQAGVIGEADLTEGLLALEEAEAQVASIRSRMDFRRRFLDGVITAQEADLALERAEVEAEIELLRGNLDAALSRYTELEERVQVGAIHPSELERARLELQRLETELEFLMMKLTTLMGGLSDS